MTGKNELTRWEARGPYPASVSHWLNATGGRSKNGSVNFQALLCLLTWGSVAAFRRALQGWLVSSKTPWRSGGRWGKEDKRDPRVSGEASTISTTGVKQTGKSQRAMKVGKNKKDRKMVKRKSYIGSAKVSVNGWTETKEK